MSTTPKDPKAGEGGPGSTRTGGQPPSVPRPRVDPRADQTLFGVAPAANPPAAPPERPASLMAAPERPAPLAAPERPTSAIIAAPTIAVSGGKASSGSAPGPRATTQTSPGADATSQSHPSESTRLHATPHAERPVPTAPIEVSSDRTALSSDYLRAAREAALGSGPVALQTSAAPMQSPGVPEPDAALGRTAPLSPTTPASAGTDALAAWGTQRSVAPPYPGEPQQQRSGGSSSPHAPDPEAVGHRGRSVAGTLFDPPAIVAEHPAGPASSRSSSPGYSALTGFEPVPAPRAALADQMLGVFAPMPSSDSNGSAWAARDSERLPMARRPDGSAARWLWLAAGGVGAAVVAVAGVLIFTGVVPLGTKARSSGSNAPATSVLPLDEPQQARALAPPEPDSLAGAAPKFRGALEAANDHPSEVAPGAAGPASASEAKARPRVNVSLATDDKTKSKRKAPRKTKSARQKRTDKSAAELPGDRSAELQPEKPPVAAPTEKTPPADESPAELQLDE
jgi:hypothetical protein